METRSLAPVAYRSLSTNRLLVDVSENQIRMFSQNMKRLHDKAKGASCKLLCVGTENLRVQSKSLSWCRSVSRQRTDDGLVKSTDYATQPDHTAGHCIYAQSRHRLLRLWDSKLVVGLTLVVELLAEPLPFFF